MEFDIDFKQVKDACGLNWSDVIWSDTDPDYVRVKNFRNDLAGATHDYTMPLFPAGALILRTRYLELHTTHSNKDLDNMPIVSKIKSPDASMGSDALIQHATSMLLSIGMTYAQLDALRRIAPDIAVSSRMLGNTYAQNVNVRCALQDEPGTAKFLQREALSGNTTDDHYTSFSDEEAGKHLHDIMSVVQPEQDIDIDEGPLIRPDGREQRCIAPETTRQRVGFVATYQLMPGEELVIRCPHGVTGSVRARGIHADGSPRRKTRKKANE